MSKHNINILRKLLFSSFAFGILAFQISATQVKTIRKKVQKNLKKTPCCAIGISYRSGPGKVFFEQICMEKQSAVLHFRTIALPRTCTHPLATIVKDQKGRSYSMLTHTGLPTCSSGEFQIKSDVPFTWTFEKLKPDVHRITVIEKPDPVTSGMGHWVWRNVNISHCKFH